MLIKIFAEYPFRKQGKPNGGIKCGVYGVSGIHKNKRLPLAGLLCASDLCLKVPPNQILERLLIFIIDAKLIMPRLVFKTDPDILIYIPD